MRLLTSLFVIPFLLFSLTAETSEQELQDAEVSGKPNILFIFADDMAYETIGAHGHLDIDTPNLDRLVKNGTSFSNAYNMGSWGGAVCIASRRMIISGRSVWNAQKVDLNSLIKEKSSWPLVLRSKGYNTYMTGKWHIPTSAQIHFTKTKNIRAGMPKNAIKKPGPYDRPKSPEDYEKGWKPWDKEAGGFWKGGKHWSETLADDSLSFLREATEKDAPFFMYLSFNAPHDPRQAPKEYIDQYPLERIKMPPNFQAEHPHVEEMCGKGMRDERLMPYPRDEYAVKVNRQEYFAIISHMDTQIGRILDALEASDKAGNTYIFFTADHGLAVGNHGLCGKQNLYEHSVKVPFLVTGPSVEKGKVVSTPIYIQDVAPTTIQLAGATVPESYYYKSLKPLLNGKPQVPWESIYGAYTNSQRMVRKGDWKLIYLPKSEHYELYNLANDSHEVTNLAQKEEHQKKFSELKECLIQHQKDLNDPLLVENNE